MSDSSDELRAATVPRLSRKELNEAVCARISHLIGGGIPVYEKTEPFLKADIDFVMSKPLEDMPLYMAHESMLIRNLAQSRIENGT